MDYSMQDGVLRMKLRASTAGYILRQWSVDCTPDLSLRGHECRLWLKNHLAIPMACAMLCWRQATALLINNGSKPRRIEG
jgi:hypothetical protein